jgi:alpha-L-fucosidase 2
MKNKKTGYSFLLVLLLPCFVVHSQQINELWYRQPAEKWTDALPLGNGRIGAMVYGGAEQDHIQFNESTLWSGKPRSYARKDAYFYLAQIRKLLAEGKQADAEAMAEAHFMGTKSNEHQYDSLKKRWFNKIRSADAPAAVNYDDHNWKVMELPTLNGWEKSGLEGVDGAVWFRTSFNLPESFSGKDLVLYLGKIRDDDYTYVNGIKVGETQGMAAKRMYRIPLSVLHPGVNTIAIQVLNWYDKGGFAGTKDGKQIFVLYSERSSKDSIKLNRSWKYWVQNSDVPEMPKYEADYQPFGDLWFNWFNLKNISEYRRSLNLDDAIASVEYKSDGVAFRREYFVSQPSHVMVMHFSADHAHKINCIASFSAIHDLQTVQLINPQTLALKINVKNGALKGVAYLNVYVKNGSFSNDNNQIRIKDADEAVFYLTAATNFINYNNITGNPEQSCQKAIREVIAADYLAEKEKHVREYQQYFHSFSIDLGSTAASGLPTDERISSFSPEKDPALIALYLQYARYLLIASSRPDAPQPANLQGIWNDQLTPPWGSKYTTNINLEMNYWPAEVLNLTACNQPLFNLIEDVSITGKETARQHYMVNGWVLHHNTDIWRGTTPINASNHGIWVSGGAWLCHHIWDHFLYTIDSNFLKRYYPVIRSAAIFFNEFLVKDSVSGYWISTPSNSPEHGGLVAGPAMDHQIIRDLFKNFIHAAEILNLDSALRNEIARKYPLIAPNKIGKYGQLQEWMQDVDDPKDMHRHVSHLWGVFPGTDITWKDSLMMHAAKQSLLQRGDGGTGWSLAWKLNLWAKFKDTAHLSIVLSHLFSSADLQTGMTEQGGIYKNMFDAHPPFQIDGNFGGASGIAEMLLQSEDGYVELLPALTMGLLNGSVKGICARTGLVFNMDWNNGQLISFEVKSKKAGAFSVHYRGKISTLLLQKNKWALCNANLEKL